jgi:hypothetical protein
MSNIDTINDCGGRAAKGRRFRAPGGQPMIGAFTFADCCPH